MTTPLLLATVGLVSNSLVIGAPIWVFFLQSPSLFAFLGRDRFIPPMMRLTKLLFRWTLTVAASLTAACAVWRSGGMHSTESVTACVSLAAVSINAIVTVPRALEAGKKATANNARKKRDGDASTTATSRDAVDFATDGGEGGSRSATRTLHQTVVLFVTVSLVASVAHVHATLSGLCRDDD